MRNRALVVAVVAASLAAPAVASAAAPWSEPIDLGPGTGTISGQLLDFAAAGTPQFTYSFTTALPTSQTPSPPRRSGFARRRPDGTVTRDVWRDDVVAQARFGRRSWVVLRYRAPQGAARRAALRVNTGRGPGELGAPQTLARYLVPEDYETAIVGSSLPTIASGPSGNVAIVWTEFTRRGVRVRLVYRLAGGGFSQPTTVAEQAPQGTLRNARLTFHGRSAVTVTYVRNAKRGPHTRRTVEARVLRLGGRPLAPQTLGPAPESYNDLRIAAAPDGRTVVAWGNVHGTVMGAQSRYTVRAALRAPNARRFGAAQVLDPGVVQVGAPGELGAGVAGDGTATVAWSAYASSSDQLVPPVEVRAATAAPSSRFAAPQVLTTSGRLTDLVVAKDGAALATWLTFADSPTIRTALRPTGATAFGAPETVADTPLRSYNPLDPSPDAAFDPSTGRFAVIWATDDSTGTPPLGTPVPGSARLLMATRQAH